jgi:hypothetical protein
MNIRSIFIETVGIYGICMILGAYFLNSFGFVPSDATSYQLMNLTGGIAFIYYTIVKRAWASLVVNVAWAIIAGVSLFGL